ncbi:hypothetical protein [Paraburkholderia sartisoli]|uniref:Uncharacterized protein n=1 Tax=Paraburkholderia sartisoli TaxID=83784 RepID=A0A1H4GLP8_9BURK|nr:hypothetical protein [Paraburkholderia sartisoli]SEB10526.1 hypothetical protein SAMN05192564_106145 [Paraburkholderia sartisoli]
MTGSSLLKPKVAPHLRRVALWRPGLLVMLAECDAGNLVMAARVGAQWGLHPDANISTWIVALREPVEGAMVGFHDITNREDLIPAA